jgi:hypothetical protein
MDDDRLIWLNRANIARCEGVIRARKDSIEDLEAINE